jgi:type I restriction enzyme R subunit
MEEMESSVYKDHVTNLSKAFAISVPHQKAFEIRDDLAFFQAIKARFAKFDETQKKQTNEEIETAIRQIVNDAIVSKEVIDVFEAAGIKKPEFQFFQTSLWQKFKECQERIWHLNY